MSKDYSKELDPEVREKMKKNLVYVGIFSIVMIFAGLTSAYIVSMGDTFWLKYPLPIGFWISTGLIAASSLTYILAIQSVKKGNQQGLKLFMSLTLLLGIGFGYFQFKGYGQLVESGAHFTSPVLVTDGRYGDYFEIKYKGDFLEVDGNDYLLKGKKMTPGQQEALLAFVKPFYTIGNQEDYKIDWKWNTDFTIYFQNEPVSVVNNKLITASGTELLRTDIRRFMFLAWNIRDGRGDFFHKGELGKDFFIYYKGKQLTYKNRSLYFNNQVLSAPLQIKANQTRDLGSSYLYIITFLHLLHIFGTIFYLIKMVKNSFKGTYTSIDHLSLKLGAIFWHFLGLLWLYLLVFLLFIH
jgi:cytochrome c oxidase subunit 3